MIQKFVASMLKDYFDSKELFTTVEHHRVSKYRITVGVGAARVHIRNEVIYFLVVAFILKLPTFTSTTVKTLGGVEGTPS